MLNNLIAYLIVFAPQTSENVLEKQQKWAHGISANFSSFAWMFQGNNVSLFDPDLMSSKVITPFSVVIAAANIQIIRMFSNPDKLSDAIIVLHSGRSLADKSDQTKSLEYRRIILTEPEDTSQASSEIENSLNELDNRFDRERKGKRKRWLKSRIIIFQNCISDVLSALNEEQDEKIRKQGGQKISTLKSNLVKALNSEASFTTSSIQSIEELLKSLNALVVRIKNNFKFKSSTDFLNQWHQNFISELNNDLLQKGTQENVVIFTSLLSQIIEFELSQWPYYSYIGSAVFDEEASIIDWNSMLAYHKAAWIEEAQAFEKRDKCSSQITQRWHDLVPNIFIPQNFQERKRVLKDLWEGPILGRHLQQWEEVLQGSIKKEN